MSVVINVSVSLQTVCFPRASIVARWNSQARRLGIFISARYNLCMDHLALIRRAAKLRERRHEAFEAADAELRRLIREGFEEGISGEKLAEAAGLSMSRVYQIRDGRR
jgi:hypothetical protein